MALKNPWEFENPSCAGIGVELFYRNEFNSDELPSNSRTEFEQVKAVCQACPCLEDCAEWGIARERWGVWGGLLPRQRELIRRRRRRNLNNHENIKLLP